MDTIKRGWLTGVLTALGLAALGLGVGIATMSALPAAPVAAQATPQEGNALNLYVGAHYRYGELPIPHQLPENCLPVAQQTRAYWSAPDLLTGATLTTPDFMEWLAVGRSGWRMAVNWLAV